MDALKDWNGTGQPEVSEEDLSDAVKELIKEVAELRAALNELKQSTLGPMHK